MNPVHLADWQRELDEIRERNEAAVLALIEVRCRSRLLRDASPARPASMTHPLLPIAVPSTPEAPCANDQ